MTLDTPTFVFIAFSGNALVIKNFPDINICLQMLILHVLNINICIQMLVSYVLDVNICIQMLVSYALDINICIQMLISYVLNINICLQMLISCIVDQYNKKHCHHLTTSSMIFCCSCDDMRRYIFVVSRLSCPKRSASMLRSLFDSRNFLAKRCLKA